MWLKSFVSVNAQTFQFIEVQSIPFFETAKSCLVQQRCMEMME